MTPIQSLLASIQGRNESLSSDLSRLGSLLVTANAEIDAAGSMSPETISEGRAIMAEIHKHTDSLHFNGHDLHKLMNVRIQETNPNGGKGEWPP